MIGMISLPINDLPTYGSMWTHLKGWWKPPSYVTEFWATACYITFDSKEDYETKREEILKSYVDCIIQFWKENVL